MPIAGKAGGLDDQTVQPQTEGLDVSREPSSTRRRGVRFWLRRLVVVAVVIALIPAGLTLLYIPSFVHPISTLMLADLVAMRGYDRRWVPLDDVAPVLVHSVIMSEDGQFCRHRGIDLGELKGVVEDMMAGEATRGASTITMQTVKNLFLWNGRTIVRKAIELPLAVYFDFVVPKRRILEIYLNIAEWGPGIYGIEAAAQYHFGVPASKLTKHQAALLAVTLPNPITRNPAKPSRGLQRLANLIQRRAAQAGGYVDCTG
jgi:monofunctional biosynthetic peptidoglycan transglycosylase